MAELENSWKMLGKSNKPRNTSCILPEDQIWTPIWAIAVQLFLVSLVSLLRSWAVRTGP